MPNLPSHTYPCETPNFVNGYRIVRNCRATDRRDSVFAIATLDAVPTVSIDYSLSVSDVYQQATFALLQRHHSIQVLRRLASPSRDPDIPSWTPDFSAPLETAGALWTLPGARFLKERQPYVRSVEQFDAAQDTLLWPGSAQVTYPSSRKVRRTHHHRLRHGEHRRHWPDHTSHRQREIDRDTLIIWEQLTSRLHTEGKRFPQSITDAFFDTILANNTHDVFRNNPPRPFVSHITGRART